MDAIGRAFPVLLALAGCASPQQAVPPGPAEPAAAETGGVGSPLWTVGAMPVSFTEVTADISDDPSMETLVLPFRSRMAAEVQEVIGETTGVLSKASPEGTLGNLAADAMLWAANRAFDGDVQMALTNNGGLRVPIGAGPVTVGQMFELMPFENMLSVVRLSGSQVQTLCDQVARMRGEPIAGFRFRIESGPEGLVAEDILVDGEPLDPGKEYLLVTNDYLANGGGSITPLHEPMAREDLPILLRDAFIEYFRHVGVVNPSIEGRITGGIGS